MQQGLEINLKTIYLDVFHLRIKTYTGTMEKKINASAAR